LIQRVDYQRKNEEINELGMYLSAIGSYPRKTIKFRKNACLITKWVI